MILTEHLTIKISHINISWSNCRIFFEERDNGILRGSLNEFYVYKKGNKTPTFLREYTKEDKIKLYILIFSTINNFMDENNMDYIFFNIKQSIPFTARMNVYRKNFPDCIFYTRSNNYDGENITDVYMVKKHSVDKFIKTYGYDEYLFESKNRYIKSFEEVINEHYGMSDNMSMASTGNSFGYSDLSTVGGTGTEQPRDANLSFDNLDAHQNNLKYQISKFVQLGKSVFNGGMYRSNNYELISDITDLYIVKIFTTSNGLIDLFIKFTLDENVYYAKFESYGGINPPNFKSAILNQSYFYEPTNKSILTGMLKDSLDKWFIPKVDEEYRALTEVKCSDNLGNLFYIPNGGKIIVSDVINQNQDSKQIIFIEYSEKIYTISGLDFYFFNWRFRNMSTEKKEFYI